MVYMTATGPSPKNRSCTFVDALHECKAAFCAGQVMQATDRARVRARTRPVSESVTASRKPVLAAGHQES